MGVPKIIQDVRDIKNTAIFPSDDTEFGPENLPIDATTLQGHPLGYFASKEDVSKILSNYIKTVLGTTY